MFPLDSRVAMKCFACSAATPVKAYLPHLRLNSRWKHNRMEVHGLAPKSSMEGTVVADDEGVRRIAIMAKTIAVLGCKTAEQASQPAFFVAQYLARAGVNVIPVPVFYPDVTEILGKQVYRRVEDIHEPLDVLVIFRKPSDLMPHLPDILAAKQLPRCVWLQSGITDPEFESALVQAGCLVVADRCIKVEHQMALAAGDSTARSNL